MSGDPGGVSERLVELFLDELDEHVERLARGLETLASAGPTAPAGLVAELFRSAHSLKGAAQATGTRAVAELCHHLEAVLAGVRDGSTAVDDDLVDALTAATDALATAARRLRGGGDVPPAAVRAAIERLTSAARRSSSTQPETRQPETPRPAPPPPSPASDAPAAAAHTAPAGVLRVSRTTMDDLLARSQELVVSTRGAERLAADTAGLAARLADDDRERLLDERVLRDALGAAVTDPRVAAALDRLDSRARNAVSAVGELARGTAEYQRSMRSLVDEFAAVAWRTRVVPFTDATTGLARAVRDLAREAGKQVRLLVSAEEVEVDRSLLGILDDVLRHLLRNAVDHGIEPPDERSAAGKPATGTIRVTATLRADGIEVAVEDDGRGIDPQAVRRAASRNGPGAEAQMDQRAVVQALFRPGLSTAGRVGAVSGRGVGLDAVRAAVEGVGGAVNLRYTTGAGVRIEFTVPVNVSGLRVVLVRAAGQLAAFPSATVRRLVRLPEPGSVVEGREVADVDGELVPVVPLGTALGWPEPAAPLPAARPAVLVTVPEGAAALLVDEFVGEQEVVVQAPGPRLAAVPTLLGTAQLDDGSVTLVVSAAACLRAAATAALTPPAEAEPPPTAPRRVLLAEDTLTTRELERGILEGAGYSVVTAVDGAHAWDLLHQHPVDVVVSDINMPRMDGIALCQTIRRSPRWAQLPVVLVTSLASDDDRRRGLDAGADAYLAKSGFDRADLLATLERLL